MPVGCHTPGKEIIQREFYLNIKLNNWGKVSEKNLKLICNLLFYQHQQIFNLNVLSHEATANIVIY